VPKFISKDWRVVINGVTLSDHAFDVQIENVKEQIDVSGFSPLGTLEFLPGPQDQTITVSFLNDFDSGKVHATIWPLYEGGSSFPILIQPDSDAGTTSSNPTYSGTAVCFNYPTSATLGERAETVVEFKPAPNSSFDWSSP
jgi:hypothetical protein